MTVRTNSTLLTLLENRKGFRAHIKRLANHEALAVHATECVLRNSKKCQCVEAGPNFFAAEAAKKFGPADTHWHLLLF